MKAVLFGAPEGCAASLPDISWVPPTLLCFSDTTSSEMPLDGLGKLWFYLLIAAVSMCQSNKSPGFSPFPVLLFPCSSWCSSPIAGHGLGAHPRSRGGG